MKIIILLLLPIICLSQENKALRPLNIGDKVPNIPFNILKMGKTSTGKDTSWTEVQWLYDFIEGKNEHKQETRVTGFVPKEEEELAQRLRDGRPTGLVKGYIGISPPSDSPAIYIDGRRYYGPMNAISPDSVRSITIYKKRDFLLGDDLDNGVISIQTYTAYNKLPVQFVPEGYHKTIPPKKKKWWQFWKRKH